jgi:hypothetical protein
LEKKQVKHPVKILNHACAYMKFWVGSYKADFQERGGCNTSLKSFYSWVLCWFCWVARASHWSEGGCIKPEKWLAIGPTSTNVAPPPGQRRTCGCRYWVYMCTQYTHVLYWVRPWPICCRTMVC